jgi:solute carrier family 35, member F1/2
LGAVNLLTSDFYGLLFGLFLYQYKPYFLYFIAFPLTLLGLIVYFSVSSPEHQGKINVRARGKRAVQEERGDEEESGKIEEVDL